MMVDTLVWVSSVNVAVATFGKLHTFAVPVVLALTETTPVPLIAHVAATVFATLVPERQQDQLVEGVPMGTGFVRYVTPKYHRTKGDSHDADPMGVEARRFNGHSAHAAIPVDVRELPYLPTAHDEDVPVHASTSVVLLDCGPNLATAHAVQAPPPTPQ